MPSLGEPTGVMRANNSVDNIVRCTCCPYGYHIDRDFVPFSKKMLSREGDVQRIQDLKDKWRSERQSMDTLLGIPNIAPLEVSTISRATRDIWKTESESLYSSLLARTRDFETPQAVEADGEQFTFVFGNGLEEAVSDFEEALLRTRPQARALSYDIPDSQKFHTFPRLKTPALKEYESASLTMKAEASKGSSPSSPKEEDVWTSLYSSATTKSKSKERVSLFCQGQDWNQATSLSEEQQKANPELEVKVTLLVEEKRQLLRLLEVEREKRIKLEETINNNNVGINGHAAVNGSASAGTGAEEESKGQVSPAPVPIKRKTRDASVGRIIMTRDIGISHVMPRTRSIGVGSLPDYSVSLDRRREDPSSPTGSLAGTLRRRVRTFEAGVQVNDCEFNQNMPSVPLLQIVERVDYGTQTTFEEPKARNEERPPELPKKVSTKTIGVSAKPSTSDISLLFKPTTRDSICNTTEPEKTRCKDIGTMASMEQADSPKSKPEKKKSMGKCIAVNTEAVTQFSVGVGTSKTKLSSTSTQTVESAYLDSADPKTVSELKSRFSLPIPGPVPSDGHRSPDPAAGPQSRIPRLASSPIPSPSASPKLGAKSIALYPDSPLSTSPLPSPEEEEKRIFTTKLPKLSKKEGGKSKPALLRTNTYTKEMHYAQSAAEVDTPRPAVEKKSKAGAQATTSFGFPTIPEKREKVKPSNEMQGALKVLNDALLRGRTTQQVTNAISIILHEWFRIAGTKTANPLDVEDYLDAFENYSPQLLRYIVNMPDGNGNTGMHYAVSHGNFDVVSVLLDSRVCDTNKANKAGYTSVMLVSLAKVLSDTHRQVVRRLFGMGDVNIKAAQHGQTALMLAASHGRLDTVKLLLEAGADINIQDEDGSTALMCASEHGHGEIVKYLLTQVECDPHLTDNDGSTALSVAMEAGHKDIGVMLYAHMHFVKGAGSSGSSSPGKVKRSHSDTQGSSPSASPLTSAQQSPSATKKQDFPATAD